MTAQHNVYILVIINEYTRWFEVYTLEHQDANLVSIKLIAEFIGW